VIKYEDDESREDEGDVIIVYYIDAGCIVAGSYTTD
jgi:hypothetical protein